MASYYEPFRIQEWKSESDGFGGWVWVWSDGVEFLGKYIQDQSSEMRIAEAQGIASSGIFVTDINIPVEEGDVIRRISDNLYLKIMGMPMGAPGQATEQIKKMSAERTEIKK